MARQVQIEAPPVVDAGLTGQPFLRLAVSNWGLRQRPRGRILEIMVKVMKKSVRKRSLTMFDRPIVYRGIKIPHTRPAFCHGSSHPRRILGAVRATAWQISARLSRQPPRRFLSTARSTRDSSRFFVR
jgi:hypothetical protein